MDVTKLEDTNEAKPLDELGQLGKDARVAVTELVDAHPLGTLAAALGAGYVLGGGLFTSLTRRLLGAGLRLGVQLALLPALEREVAGLAANLGKSLGGSPLAGPNEAATQ